MAIKVPTYERKVEGLQQNTAQSKAPAPIRQAYGENVAQATGNLGNTIAQLGQDFLKINAKNNKDKILLETGKFDLEYKKFKANLNNRDDYQNFNAETDRFLETQLNNMKTSLGDELFNKWWNIEGNLLSDSVKIETDIMKVPASIKQQNKLLKDNISAQSYNYATSEDKQDIIKKSVKNQIITSNQNDFIKKGMLDDVDTEFAKADIDYWINIDPEKVKKNIESGKYKKGDKSFLTAKEESNYLKLCDSRIKALEGTIYQTKIQPIYQEFENLYAQSPSSANKYYNKVSSNRKILEEKGFNGKEINSVLNYMNKVLKEGVIGEESNRLTSNNDIDKRLLLNKKKNLENEGDYLPIEDYLNFINTTNKILNSNYLTKEGYKQILKNRDEVYGFLGESVINEGYNPTTIEDSRAGILWKDVTNNGYLKNNLKKVFKDSGFLDENNFKDITPQEVGVIYYQAYKYCNGISMGEATTESDKIKIQEAVSKALIQFVSVKYGKNAKDSSDILIERHILKLRNNIKNQTVGFTLNSYKD